MAFAGGGVGVISFMAWFVSFALRKGYFAGFQYSDARK
jgi:hypothetical protein